MQICWQDFLVGLFCLMLNHSNACWPQHYLKLPKVSIILKFYEICKMSIHLSGCNLSTIEMLTSTLFCTHFTDYADAQSVTIIFKIQCNPQHSIYMEVFKFPIFSFIIVNKEFLLYWPICLPILIYRHIFGKV